MNINKPMAWFIIIVMVASTIGFAAISSQSRPSSNPTDMPPEIPPQEPTSFDFKAENVPATVYQILPSMKILAKTDEQDKSKIDAIALSLTGVKNVRSEFKLSETETLDYVAEISYDKEITADEMVLILEENTPLTEITAFPFAMVEIPKTLTLVPQAEALDFEREYTFEDTIATVLVGVDSQKDDEIEVQLSISLTGEDLTYLFGYESANLTAELKTHTISLDLEIYNLESEIQINTFPFDYKELNLETLQTDLASNENIESVSLESEILENKFIFLVNSILGASMELFKEKLEALEEIETATITESDEIDEITISFSEETTYPEAKQLAIEKFGELELSEEIENPYTINPPQMDIRGTAILTNPNAGTAFDFIEEKFTELEIETDLMQMATASLETIEDPESGETYIYEDKEFSVTLNSAHEENETISLEINYYTSRDKVEMIFATEVQETDLNE